MNLNWKFFEGSKEKMDNFKELMQQAVSIKSGQMLEKRKKFEQLPLFVKAGLYYQPKYHNVHQQGFHQRLSVAELLKLKGNKEFSLQKYDQAAHLYEQALSIFRFVNNRNPKWKNEGILDEDLTYVDYEGESNEEIEVLRTLKIALYLNLAICYLRLSDYKNSKASCEEALKIDPRNTKALYRRAKALTADINSTVSDYREALEDLNKANAIDPTNTDIQQEITRFKMQIAKIVADENKVKGFLNKQTETKLQSTKETAPGSKDAEKNYQGIQGSDENQTEATISAARKQTKDDGDAKKAETKEISIEKKSSSKETSSKSKDNDGPSETQRSGSLTEVSKSSEAKNSTELKDLEKLLEARGNEMIRLYNSVGRHKEAQELHKKLEKAMGAKKHLEKLEAIDWNSPNEFLKEAAEKFDLDLTDPEVRAELKQLQEENLAEIRKWIDDLTLAIQTGRAPMQKPKALKRKTPKSSTIEANKSKKVSENSSAKNSQDNQKRTQGSYGEALGASRDPQHNGRKHSEINRTLNLALVTVAVMLLGLTVYLQMR